MLSGLVAASVLALAAAPAGQSADPIGDFLQSVGMQPSATQATPSPTLEGTGTEVQLQATLYHAGASGVGSRDSLGCQVVAMRTVAVDKSFIRRRTILFIKETVGMDLPGGGVHDGLWYASDTGGAIKGQRIDLYTGKSSRTMSAFMARGINKGAITVKMVGEFDGCPQEHKNAGEQVASR